MTIKTAIKMVIGLRSANFARFTSFAPSCIETFGNHAPSARWIVFQSPMRASGT
jgi:hypothetical protein